MALAVVVVLGVLERAQMLVKVRVETLVLHNVVQMDAQVVQVVVRAVVP